MAKASDNPFPSVLLVEGATPATPAAGQARLFVDSADGALKHVDDSGAVHTPSGGGTAGRVLLKQTILAADAATITFTSSDIPTSGYNHLEIVVAGRTTQAVFNSPIYVAFNSDTTDANYYRQIAGISASTSYVNAGAGREVGYLGGASAAAGQGGSIRLLLPDYLRTTFFKTILSTTSGGTTFTGTIGQNWKNTSAVTSIALTTSAANFLTGTSARLYGLV